MGSRPSRLGPQRASLLDLIPRPLAHETTGRCPDHHHRKSAGLRSCHPGRGAFSPVDQALSLDSAPGPQRDASGAQASDVPRIARRDILELDGDEYRSSARRLSSNRSPPDPHAGLLTDVPQTVEALGLKAKLGRTTAQRVLSGLGPKVAGRAPGPARPLHVLPTLHAPVPSASDPGPSGFHSAQPPCNKG